MDGLDPEITERLIQAGRRAAPGRVGPGPRCGARHFHAGRRVGFCVGVVCDRHQSRCSRRLRFRHARSARPAGRPQRPLTLKPSTKLVGRLARGRRVPPVRGGDPFWTLLGRGGIRSAVLFAPGTFPPEPVSGGHGPSRARRCPIGPAGPVPATRGWPPTWRPIRLDSPATADGSSGSPSRATWPMPRWSASASRSGRGAVDDHVESGSAQRQHRRRRQSAYLAEGQQSRWLEVSVRLNVLTSVPRPGPAASGQGGQRRAAVRVAHSVASRRSRRPPMSYPPERGDRRCWIGLARSAPWPGPSPAGRWRTGASRTRLSGRAGGDLHRSRGSADEPRRIAGWHLIVAGMERWTAPPG